MKFSSLLLLSLIFIGIGCSFSSNKPNVIVNFDEPNQKGLKVYSYIDLNDTINYRIKNNSSIINIPQEQFLQIKHNEHLYNFYASPGNTIDVKINPQGDIYFNGDLAEINNTLTKIDKKYPLNIPSIHTSDPQEIMSMGDSIEKEILSLIPDNLSNDEKSFLKNLIVKRVFLDEYINFLFNNCFPQGFNTLQQEIINEDEYVKQKFLPSHVALELYKNLSLYKKQIQLNVEMDSILKNEVHNSYNLELLESRILKDSIMMEGNSYLALKSISKFQSKYPNSIYTPSIIKASNVKELIAKGQSAKDIAVIDKMGIEKNILKDSHEIIVIDIWATWCKPCIEALPKFISLEEKYKNEQISFIKISIDDDKNKWKQFNAIPFSMIHT